MVHQLGLSDQLRMLLVPFLKVRAHLACAGKGEAILKPSNPRRVPSCNMHALRIVFPTVDGRLPEVN